MCHKDRRLSEVLLVEDDPGDVLLIREAFEDDKIDEFFVGVVRPPRGGG